MKPAIEIKHIYDSLAKKYLFFNVIAVFNIFFSDKFFH